MIGDILKIIGSEVWSAWSSVNNQTLNFVKPTINELN